MRKIGVFGGNFDPIHNAHIVLADAAQKALGLDEVRLFPCGKPSHRDRASASGADRLEMARLAVQGYPHIVVDDWELTQDSVSYSYKTLEYLSEASDAQLFFLMGADSLLQFTTWRKWQRILQLSNLAVMARTKNELNDLPPELGRLFSPVGTEREQHAGRIYLLEVDEMDVSSTLIRALLNDGEPTDGLLDPSVQRYVSEQKLYSNNLIGKTESE